MNPNEDSTRQSADSVEARLRNAQTQTDMISVIKSQRRLSSMQIIADKLAFMTKETKGRERILAEFEEHLKDVFRQMLDKESKLEGRLVIGKMSQDFVFPSGEMGARVEAFVTQYIANRSTV